MYQPPNQPQYPPQPNTYYPPQQPPPPLPRKKRSLWLILGIIVGVSILCGSISTAITRSAPSAQPTPTTVAQATDTPTDTPLPTYGITPVPTDTPAPPPKWTITHTFSGSGEKTTETFDTSGDWKLVWTAQASSCCDAFFGASVYGSDGSLVDSGTDATIPAGKKMTDSNEEHTGAGSFYLKVYAGVVWTVQVMELK
jgi:hypothetical protein